MTGSSFFNSHNDFSFFFTFQVIKWEKWRRGWRDTCWGEEEKWTSATIDERSRRREKVAGTTGMFHTCS